MSKSTFRSSTSLVLSLSLAVGPAWSQETAPICDPAAPQLPCTLDGTLIESADELSGALGVEVAVVEANELVEEAPTDPDEKQNMENMNLNVWISYTAAVSSNCLR